MGVVSAGVEVVGVVAARIVDEHYGERIAKAKRALTSAVTRVLELGQLVARKELTEAHSGFLEAMRELEKARSRVKKERTRRRTAYKKLANVASGRGSGRPAVRAKIGGAVAAIPKAEVVVTRASAVLSAVKSGLVSYNRESGIGYGMAINDGITNVLNAQLFPIYLGFLHGYRDEFAGHVRRWRERISNLRALVNRLGGGAWR